MQATVPAEDVPEHEHDEAHVVLTLRGTYLSDASDMPTECGEPALVFNPPGTRHRDRFASTDGLFMVVSLPTEAWRRYSPPASTARRAHRLGVDALAVGLRLASSLGAGDTAARLDLEADIDALLQVAAQRTLPPIRRAPRWLARARENLATADAEVSLAAIARDCGVQPAQLSRAFQAFEGCTPGRFLRRQRLQRVVGQWSRDDAISLSDAAQAAGFFDHSHMVRAMREEIRLTPSQLRRLFREASDGHGEASGSNPYKRRRGGIG
jgi:AraC family transcriptional regulator